MGKDNELLEASRNGNLAVVEKILQQKSKKSAFHSLRRGGGVNVQDSSGYSALHHAALNGHFDICHLLLSHTDDVNPNLLDSRGSSPLHLAAWAGHHEICKLLLSHPISPANPNSQTVDIETPLHFAAQHGHVGALTTLLAHGGDPNILNVRDESPLDLAAQYGRLQIVQILIRAHNELLLPLKLEATNFSHSPLHLSSRNGHRDVVEVLLAAGCNVNLLTPNGSALHEAALCGKDNVVRVLLRAHIDLDAIDSDGRTVIDLLEQFPPHVTTRIRNVINHHRNSIYDSESDDLRDGSRNYSFGSSSYESSRNNWNMKNIYGHQNQKNPKNPQKDLQRSGNRYEEQYDAGTTSPSSSMGSLGGPPSPSQRGVYVAMKPISGKGAPAKPPRRTLSTSPPHQTQSMKLMSQSFDASRSGTGSRNGKNDQQEPSNQRNNNTPKARNAYEYLYFAHSGDLDTQQSDNQNSQRRAKPRLQLAPTPDDGYMVMNQPINLPTNVNYENHIVRVINPNRKLRRNKTAGGFDQSDTETFIQIRRHPDEPPLSPTHYQQPGTPEHPPPSARNAEKYIHERIRPLSQEYKRRSGRLDLSLASPGLGASSGSLSSSVSLSSSTDCVEEFVAEVPFAGLFKGSTMTLNNANNPNGFGPRPSILRTRTASQSSDEETHRFTNNNNEHADKAERNNLNVLSPFDENEEWAKISEIMASFGSGIVRESVFVNDIENEFKSRLGMKTDSSNGSLASHAESNLPPFKQWLFDIKLEHLEEYFVENGYDEIKFLNGIINENDLLVMGIPENDRKQLLEDIAKLTIPPTIVELQNNKINNNGSQNITLTVDQWLKSIQLEEYSEIFRKHLYIDMEKIYSIWEIELQAVLEITKIGHRKRILHSLIGHRLEPPNIDEINSEINAEISSINSSIKDLERIEDKVIEEPIINVITNATNAKQKAKPTPAAKPTTLSRHKKKAPAPQPPVRANNLEIRAPSELLLGPSGLRAQWRHSASALVSGSIKYEVFYLGSTVVKELRGTESTRKSIQKLKRGERLAVSAAGQQPSQQLLNNFKRPVCLAISHLGVQFIDIETQGAICDHEIRNIDCACQDADDLSHFAYITKDLENNTHYCHVFNVDSMDLATEIILTLGQAFEVAYQLALRDTTTTPLKSPSNGKRPMSATSSSDHG